MQVEQVEVALEYTDKSIKVVQVEWQPDDWQIKAAIADGSLLVSLEWAIAATKAYMIFYAGASATALAITERGS
jgi:hypothetical protein